MTINLKRAASLSPLRLLPLPKSFKSKPTPSSSFNPCVLSKEKHPLWRCSAFKEKTPTQRAKIADDNKLCFSCLSGVHASRECTKSIKCSHSGCEKSHNSLLHGAERIFPVPQKKQSDSSGSRKPDKSSAAPAAASSKSSSACATSASDFDTRGLIPVATVRVSSGSGSEEVLALCDTGSIHSWISDKLASRLGLSGFPTRVTLNGIVTKDVIDTQRVKCDVTSAYADPSFSFDLKPFT